MPPPRQHTWAKLQAGEQGRLDGSRCLRRAGMVAEWPQKCPHQQSLHARARPPVSTALGQPLSQPQRTAWVLTSH